MGKSVSINQHAVLVLSIHFSGSQVCEANKLYQVKAVQERDAELDKLYPTLEMKIDITVYFMLGRTERLQCCQFAGKYACNYKKVQLKCWRACRDAL